MTLTWLLPTLRTGDDFAVESWRGTCGPQALLQWGAGTQPQQSQAEQAGHLGRGCWRQGTGAWTDVQRWPQRPTFSTVLCPSPQLLYLLYFYTWLRPLLCGGNEMWVQTQLFLVAKDCVRDTGGSSTKGVEPSVHKGSAETTL